MQHAMRNQDRAIRAIQAWRSRRGSQGGAEKQQQPRPREEAKEKAKVVEGAAEASAAVVLARAAIGVGMASRCSFGGCALCAPRNRTASASSSRSLAHGNRRRDES